MHTESEAQPRAETEEQNFETRIDRLVAHSGEKAEQWGKALERPIVGASVAGALFAAMAGAWGPTEAVLGAAAGLLVYRMLKRRAGKQLSQGQTPKEQPVH